MRLEAEQAAAQADKTALLEEIVAMQAELREAESQLAAPTHDVSDSDALVGGEGEGTLICCGALWTPRCHLPCHVTVL